MIAAVESIVEFDLDVSLFVNEKASFQEGQAAQPKLVAAINRDTGQPSVDSRGGPMFTVYRSCRRPISRRSPM
jgi:hypothetical protein